jgi:hypothetical protein
MVDLLSLKDSPSADHAAELAHLSEHECGIIKRELGVATVSVTFLKLFQYAATTELIIIFISAPCAIIGGTALPIPNVSVLYSTLLKEPD